jgi:hypothetical protein
MALDRTAFLGLSGTFALTEVPLPEGLTGDSQAETVWVRSMSRNDREHLKRDLKRSAEGGDAKLMVRSLANADGSLMFAVDEWRLLSAIPSKVADTIIAAATYLNTISDEERVELEKNFKRQS